MYGHVRRRWWQFFFSDFLKTCVCNDNAGMILIITLSINAHWVSNWALQIYIFWLFSQLIIPLINHDCHCLGSIPEKKKVGGEGPGKYCSRKNWIPKKKDAGQEWQLAYRFRWKYGWLRFWKENNETDEWHNDKQLWDP